MDLGINLRFDHQLLAVEAEHHVHCMLELTAPPAPTARARKPLHLALVIDKSGSMRGRKLATAIECAVYLAHRLSPTDHLGVVTYDTNVTPVWPMRPVGPSTTQLERALRSITSGGMTNLSGGWLKGVEQLRGIPGGSGPKKVLLLSDGLANVGISDTASLVQMAHGAEEEGVGTTTIGFGERFDEDLMTGMADAGSGTAHLAATPEEAPAIFAKEFEGLASIVAQNLSVELRPTDEVKVLSVLNDYPQVPVLGGIQLQLGDAVAEERRRILFELFVPRLAELGVTTAAHAVVRYVSMGAQIVAHELTVPITVNLVAADEAAASGADHEVTEEVVVLKAARAQSEARDRATSGDIDGARGLLRHAAKQLRATASTSARADELGRQADEMEEHLGTLEAGGFDRIASKKMRYQSRARQRRREADE